MTQYNSLNVKLSKSQLNKLKSAIKNETDVVLRLSLNMIDKSDNETSFPHTLAAASAADAGIHKKILGSGYNTTLIISNDEVKDILEIVTSLEDSGLLLKGVGEIIKNEAKEQKRGFLSMLLGTLGASFLGNMLSGKGVVRAGEGTARVGYGSKRFSLKKRIDSATSFNKL